MMNVGDSKRIAALRIVLWLLPAIVLCVGSLDHFLYDWTECPFIGTWSPTDESLWEHLKIAFYPTVAVWIVVYFIFRSVLRGRYCSWFAGCAVAAIASACSVVLLQYFLIDVFGLPNKIYVHIPEFFVALAVGQAVGIHVALGVDEDRAIRCLLALASVTAAICVTLSVYVAVGG